MKLRLSTTLALLALLAATSISRASAQTPSSDDGNVKTAAAKIKPTTFGNLVQLVRDSGKNLIWSGSVDNTLRDQLSYKGDTDTLSLDELFALEVKAKELVLCQRGQTLQIVTFAQLRDVAKLVTLAELEDEDGEEWVITKYTPKHVSVSALAQHFRDLNGSVLATFSYLTVLGKARDVRATIKQMHDHDDPTADASVTLRSLAIAYAARRNKTLVVGHAEGNLRLKATITKELEDYAPAELVELLQGGLKAYNLGMVEDEDFVSFASYEDQMNAPRPITLAKVATADPNAFYRFSYTPKWLTIDNAIFQQPINAAGYRVRMTPENGMMNYVIQGRDLKELAEKLARNDIEENSLEVFSIDLAPYSVDGNEAAMAVSSLLGLKVATLENKNKLLARARKAEVESARAAILALLDTLKD